MAHWHHFSAEQVLESLQTSAHGLTEVEAARRLMANGPNLFSPSKKRSAWRRFFLQFNNILIYVLLAAAGVTGLLAHWLDCAVILGVVLINALIGFLQEGKAEQALAAIRKLLAAQATVLREGRRRVVAAETLVLGDVVWLQAGDKVVADLRLLAADNLRIEEAALTGESLPVEKITQAVAENSALGDRRCLAYCGTLVVAGQGVGVVVATGAETEVGRISMLLDQVSELRTPLLQKISVFSQRITMAILLLAGFTFGVGWLWHQHAASEMFLAAVSMAVAAIPEGLPAIISITLALGVRRMASLNAIVRRLPAVETLGSVTVICTDKTGTLTRNEMTVQRVMTADFVLTVSGEGYAPRGEFKREGKHFEASALSDIFRAGLLCNDSALHEVAGAWQLVGDPTEGALLTLAVKAGLNVAAERAAWSRLAVLPFSSEQRWMATLHQGAAGAAHIFIKGAPEAILARCAWQRIGDKNQPLALAYWQQQIEVAAARGERVLALAMKVSEASALNLEAVAGDFILLGMLGMMDPPRAEASLAVRECRAAGIRVKMMSGDHAVTARAIAAQMNIGDGRVLVGAEIDALDHQALRKAVAEIDVFARASPQHKLRLVEALQANGEIVAMTGDGVNDAPALKRADIGVAMGLKGTEVAKEAAQMVLADDNFATLAHAVKAGRTVYDNIEKGIVFVVPTNGGEAGMVLVAVLLGVTLPITPVQILWVNMVSAVTLALALAFEKTEAGVMRRPPRGRNEAILSNFMLWRIGFVSLLLTVGPYGLFLWESARGSGLELSRTLAVNALVVGQIFYLFNCRFLLASIFSKTGWLGNKVLLLNSAILLALQMALTYLPVMQKMFGTIALDGAAWFKIFAFGVLVLLLVETEKWLLRRVSAAV